MIEKVNYIIKGNSVKFRLTTVDATVQYRNEQITAMKGANTLQHTKTHIDG